MRRIIVTCYIILRYCCSTAVIGGLFRINHDEHLATAFKMAVQWARTNLYKEVAERAPPLEGKIRYTLRHDLVTNGSLCCALVCTLIDEDGAIGIIGAFQNQMHVSTSQIESITDRLQVPFMKAFWTAQPHQPLKTKTSFTIDVFPAIPLANLIREWLIASQWRKFIFVFSRNNALLRFHKILSDPQFEITFLHIDVRNMTSTAQQLAQITDHCLQWRCRKSKFSVLVDIPDQLLHSFFHSMLQFGLLNFKFWYFTTTLNLDQLVLSWFSHNWVKITSVHLRTTEEPLRTTSLTTEVPSADFVQKLIQNCKNAWYRSNPGSRIFPLNDVLMVLDSVLAFAMGHSKAYKYFPVVNKPEFRPCCNLKHFKKSPTPYTFGNKLTNFIKHQSYIGTTGSIKFTESGGRTNVSFNIAELGYDGKLHKFSWNSYESQSLEDSALSPLYITKQMKPHLRITTIEAVPYITFKKNFKYFMGNDRFEGFCVDLLKQLGKDLDFTYTITLVNDGQYGAILNDSKWNGMIGELLENRAEVVSFTKPFLQHGISMLVRSPQQKDASFEAFLFPLRAEIWLCILASLCLVIVGMFIIARISPYEWVPVKKSSCSCARKCPRNLPPKYAGFRGEYWIGGGRTEEVLENKFSLSYTVWYMLSTLLKAGSEDSPSAMSTRVLAGVWWITTLILIHTYTANFAAVLTVDRQNIPIADFHALLNQSYFSFGAREGGSTLQFFKESHLPIFQRLWYKMNQMDPKEVFVQSEKEGVNRVLRGRYAYFVESTSLEYLVSRNCNLTQAGSIVIGNNGYGIAMRKGSALIDKISRTILNYTENGVIPEFKHRWWTTKASIPCPNREGSRMKYERRALSIYDIMGLFVTFSAGIALAFALGLIEFAVLRNTNPLAKKSTSNSPTELKFCGCCDMETESQHGADPSIAECSDCQKALVNERNDQIEEYEDFYDSVEHGRQNRETDSDQMSLRHCHGTHVPLGINSTVNRKRRWNVSQV